MPRSSPGVSAWLLLGAIGGVLGGPLWRPPPRSRPAPPARSAPVRRTRRSFPGKCWSGSAAGSRVRRTPSGGSSTAPRRSTGSAPRPRTTRRSRFGENGAVIVRANVDGLAYDQTYHYRLVVQYPDGSDRDRSGQRGAHAAGCVAAAAASRIRWSDRPTPARTHLDTLSVLDALPGSMVTVSCAGEGCKAPEQKLVLDGGRQSSATGACSRRMSCGWWSPAAASRRSRRSRHARTAAPSSRPSAVASPLRSARSAAPPCRSHTAGPNVGRFAITDVTRGSTVQIICRGRGCPRQRLHQARHRQQGRPVRRRLPRGYGALRPGATLHVFITRPNTFGLTVRFRVTREDVDRGPYRCLSPNVPLRRVACPTAPSVTTGRGAASATASALPPIVTVPFSTVAKSDGAGGPARARRSDHPR